MPDFYTHSTAVKRLLGVQYEVWWLARTISALYSAFAGSIIHNVRAVTRPLLREERSFERRVKEDPTLDLFSLLLLAVLLLGSSWCYLSVSDWIKGGAGALMPLTPIFNIWDCTFLAIFTRYRDDLTAISLAALISSIFVSFPSTFLTHSFYFRKWNSDLRTETIRCRYEKGYLTQKIRMETK